MEIISRLSRWMKSRTSLPGEAEAHQIHEILHSDIQRVRNTDPETRQQWQRLNIALGHDAVRLTPPLRAARIFLARPAVAFAVAAILVITGGVFWLLRPSTMTYMTQRGQITTVLLSDSSEVMLHHTSELIVDQTPLERTRHVTLAGEGFFRIRKTGTPFIVTTSVGTIRVLGTAFNVRVRDGFLEVAVVTGLVQVGARVNGRDSIVVLGQGQMMTCPAGGYPETPMQTAFSDYPGWIHGKLLFNKSTLPSICRELEARFDVTITFQDSRLGQETITGALDARTIDTALTTLSRLTGKQYRHENSVYTLF